MSLNAAPSGERIHIGFFGRRNAGKSSLVNAVTGQELAVVSDIKGTTTDPVQKAMELLPLGPVVIIDTPGYDDEGTLGELRILRTKQVLNKVDIAVLVVDATSGIQSCEEEILSIIKEKDIPYVIAYNKKDLLEHEMTLKENEILVSATENTNIHELKELIGHSLKDNTVEKYLVRDLVEENDIVVLVIPIDSSAPKGRLILPQQMMIRDLLDSGAASVCVKDTELEGVIKTLGSKVKMVITDSQAFAQVSKIVPDEIPLTSFSILLARYKGFLEEAVRGVSMFNHLEEGDTVLISEGCSHHRQCEDIGTVKIPKLLRQYTGKNINFETSSGRDFPEDLSPYKMVIHCGGCMITEREVMYRMKCAVDQNVPFTNYGISLACFTGILERGVRLFPHLSELLEK